MRCTGYEMVRYKVTQASHLYEKSMHTLCTISEQPLLAESSTILDRSSCLRLRPLEIQGILPLSLEHKQYMTYTTCYKWYVLLVPTRSSLFDLDKAFDVCSGCRVSRQGTAVQEVVVTEESVVVGARYGWVGSLGHAPYIVRSLLPQYGENTSLLHMRLNLLRTQLTEQIKI